DAALPGEAQARRHGGVPHLQPPPRSGAGAARDQPQARARRRLPGLRSRRREAARSRLGRGGGAGAHQGAAAEALRSRLGAARRRARSAVDRRSLEPAGGARPVKLLRRIRVEEWITLGLIALAIGLMRLSGVPFGVRRVLDGIGLAYQQSALLLLMAAVPALIALHFTGRLKKRETNPLTWANLGELVRCNLSFVVCIFIYSNLKAALPRLNPYLFDDELLRIDRVLFFGHAPNQFLPLLRPHWLVRVMDEAYSSFFLFFPATMGLAFFLADRRALRTFVAGYVLCFYF